MSFSFHSICCLQYSNLRSYCVASAHSTLKGRLSPIASLQDLNFYDDDRNTLEHLQQQIMVSNNWLELISEIDWLYQTFTAHQHQKGHTVPKQVRPLDDDDVTESTRKKMSWFSSLWTALRTALCESIRYQAKSEQNVRQDLIPRVRHGEAAFCTPGNDRIDVQEYTYLWYISSPE